MVRFKNRWLLLSLDTAPLSSLVASHPPFTPQTLTKLLRNAVATNFGDVASGTLGGSLVCKYYSSHTGTAIVRCARQGAKLVWAAASLVSSTNPDTSASGGAQGQPLRIRVLHLGGTIKKVQLRAMELDRKAILQLREAQSYNRNPSQSSNDKSTNKLLESSKREITAVS
ncbi:RNA-binding protein pop5 [Thecaphora frezii]